MTELSEDLRLTGLIERLRSLGKAHDDMSVGKEAADEIIRLIQIILRLMDTLEAYTATKQDKGETEMIAPPMTDARKAARYDDLVDTIEELHDEVMILTAAIRQTLAENGHLADGENCTLYALKTALRRIEGGGI